LEGPFRYPDLLRSEQIVHFGTKKLWLATDRAPCSSERTSIISACFPLSFLAIEVFWPISNAKCGPELPALNTCAMMEEPDESGYYISDS
jgi:hypothetical protein